MKLVFISDTHCLHEQVKVPNGDIVFHCGDALSYGTHKEFLQFIHWYASLPHKYKVYTPGNHDRFVEAQFDLAKIMCQEKGIHLLHNELISIEGLSIYGSAFTPTFFNWSFMLDRGLEIKKAWDKIPTDLDVLISHGPPYGILDECSNGHVGCEELNAAILLKKPKIAAFGHIHEQGAKIESKNNILYINASVCDEDYRPVNSPTVVNYGSRCF